MTVHDHSFHRHNVPDHAAPPDDRGRHALPLSLLAQSAAVRLGAVALVVVLLWLAVLWAVSLP